ncbi:type VII toxin-antitoxin system MntA family adenylyltransferase antitoxin [Desulfoscipio gibsoniae]|uniref:Putative nucleotidyltransferase n=1 Tax=Desulfoscipio gibsoniae DSM 7213 TaxID=767817 RepID=R4KA03_9FIRM|nr:nucleotidyltransferase domain-containing protein [Desulfoscipio gibsoniae]AGK99992.1 putative nucleotidyltransferase [Desulfoscipio gibsoniae DSM 7213]
MQSREKEINVFISKLVKILELRRDIAAVYLFGSYGTEFQTKHSDIDLGVIFLPEVNADLRTELELEVALSLAMGTDQIDVVNLNRSPIQLRYRAISEGCLIYQGDYVATSNFLEETYKYYLDYAYHLKNFHRERSKALKEAYANGG